MSLKNLFGGKCWNQWPDDIKLRYHNALHYYGVKLSDDIKFHKFLQFIFFKQWSAIKKYANSKQIKIIGDVPIFVAYDSSDVWSNKRYFQLDEKGNLTVIAGVPPDYFSETGQLWGNPLYNWDAFKNESYDWWLKRIGYSIFIYDGVRIDHFRGFEACWTVAASEKTAINGKWIKAPGTELFNRIFQVIKSPFILAEDLGLITDEVEILRDRFSFPGMKIMQFSFSDETNAYLPHNFTTSNCIAYTGTHDNDTTVGWFKSLDKKSADLLKKYIPDINISNCNWKLIEFCLASCAKYAVIPMQDLFGFGSESRMNTPGAAEGNWQWRFKDCLYKNDIKNNSKTSLFVKLIIPFFLIIIASGVIYWIFISNFITAYTHNYALSRGGHINFLLLKLLLIVTLAQSVIIFFIYSYFIRRIIILPIKKIIMYMRQIGDGGEFTDFSVGGAAEFSLLIKQFKNMLDKLNETNIELENAREKNFQLEKYHILSNLSSGISHEINNPVNNISLYLETLNLSNTTNTQTSHIISKIENELSKITNITTRFNDFSKMSFDSPKEINIQNFVENIKEFLDYYFKKFNFEFCLEINLNNNNKINLIKNAIEAIDEKKMEKLHFVFQKLAGITISK